MSKNSLFTDFFSNLDIIQFVESCLVLQGQPYRYLKNGRDFMADILRYGAHVLPYSNKAKPMVVLKGRQIGMSTATSALMLYYMYAEDHKTFGHFFPEVGMARRHSSKTFIEMIEDSMVVGKLPKDFLNKRATQSQAQKDFHRSNTIYIEGVSTDARRIRGMSLTGLPVYDEFASTTREAYKNSLETAANSHFGYVDNNKQIPHIVFGTPESEGSLFENIWDMSDKREYHLKCTHCGMYFPLFYEVKSRDDVFTNLKHGTLVACMDREGRGCGGIMDKKDKAMQEGKWMSSLTEEQKQRNKDKFGDTHNFVGFYVPQFLSGEITRESIDHKRQNDPPRVFANEVLGKFYSNVEDALTPAQVLHYTATKPNTGDWDLPTAILDKKTFMGIDWGGRASGEEDNGMGSYTVVTILSLLPTGQLKLEHASRLNTTDIDDQLKQIRDLVKRFNVCKIIADRGYGEAQRQRLTQTYGDLFTACLWSSNMKKAQVYAKDVNLITADKHVLHENFFDQLRQYKFCFPNSQKAEEELEWMREHITNVEVVNVEVSGMIKKTYQKKRGKETDGLASLIYAYTAFQFVKTAAFTKEEHGLPSTSNRGSLLGTVSVVPQGRSMRQHTHINYSRSDRRRRHR